MKLSILISIAVIFIIVATGVIEARKHSSTHKKMRKTNAHKHHSTHMSTHKSRVHSHKAHKAHKKHKSHKKDKTTTTEVVTTTTTSVVSNSLTLDPKCGCQIVLSWFKKPEKKEVRSYDRRWKNVEAYKPPPPKIPIDPRTATCSESQGEELYKAFGEMFNMHVLRNGKVKKEGLPDPKDADSKTVKTETGVTTDASGKAADMKKVLGEFGEEVWQHGKTFIDNKKTDEAAALAAKNPKPMTAKEREAANHKEKKTVAQIQQEKAQKLKREFIAANRKKCYDEIRRYLNPKIQGKYREPKCSVLGRLMKRCFAL